MDVMKVIDGFYQNGTFEKSFNATFISLIPNKIGAEEVKDYMPISLQGSIYKIISKTSTERLKKVIEKIISNNQNAFLKGRQIIDATFVANECLDHYLIKRKAGIMCKLDLEKAYDHVSLSFLMGIVRQMNFGDKWRQ